MKDKQTKMNNIFLEGKDPLAVLDEVEERDNKNEDNQVEQEQ